MGGELRPVDLPAFSPDPQRETQARDEGASTRALLQWAWRVAWSGKYLIFATWLLLIVPTVLYLQQADQLYTADARIMVEGPEATDLLSERAIMAPWLSENMMYTQVEVVSSTALAKRVADRLGLDKDPEFNPDLAPPRPMRALLGWLNPLRWLVVISSGKPPEDESKTSAEAQAELKRARVVAALQSKLVVRMQRRSYIIQIQATSESPAKAALIANTLADAYVVDRLESSFENARRVASWLGERLDTLRADVAAAERAAEEFRAANNLRRKGERQQTVADQQLSELNSRLILARSELAQKQARLDQIRTLLRNNVGLEASADVLQSTLIQRLVEQESQLEREATEASKIYGDRHPRIVGFRAEQNQLRDKIKAEMQHVASSVANEVEVSLSGMRTLERDLDGLRRTSNQASEAEVKLRELERQADAARGLYEAFLSRFKREADADGGGKRANARILSAAEVPNLPSAPSKGQLLFLMTVLSLLAGFALVFVLERLDNAVRSTDQLEYLTGLPTLAVIPALRSSPKDMRTELLEHPRSALADSIRGLRIAVDLNADWTGKGQRGRVVAITSSVPKEGKTFLAMCLAIMCARTDKRVLLIDGDIHRPRLHTMVNLPNEMGLVQILAGTHKADDIIVRDIAPGLDFLPAGQMSNVTDLVDEAGTGALLKDLSAKYHWVVMDLPPVLAVADTRIMTRLADHVIYLVRWNSATRDAVRNGIKLLREARAPIFGVVLSQVNQRKHARYAYGDYGHYYGRYRDYYAE